MLRSTRTEKGGSIAQRGNISIQKLRLGPSRWATPPLRGRRRSVNSSLENSLLEHSSSISRKSAQLGTRLKGYGWISSGDEQIAKRSKPLRKSLSDRADQLFTRMDILDIVNWLGTILSSRRSAQIAFLSTDNLNGKSLLGEERVVA